MKNLVDIFDKVARRMQIDFDEARAALDHSSLKGDAFEESFRGFLRRYLPKKLDILQGTIIDAQGNTTRQLDVIITDAASTPIFYESGNTRVVPAEMVYAVIEVKANLDIAELKRSLENMASVRALSKTAYQPGGVFVTELSLYGKNFTIWPTNYYIFAIDSAPLDNLCAFLRDYYNQHNLPPENRIDSICVLNRGMIVNQDAYGNIDALPTATTRLGSIKTKRPLLLFYVMTSRYWFQTQLPPLNIIPYLQDMNFGDNEH